ncbi:MAG: shikimate kinase, partial [Endozoicomonadaceae bacterium]|nr:shikimate kinase [Endozoicomonadaceae bacterium]
KDSDKIIESNSNSSITDIFKYKGEAYFRSKEVETIKDILTGEPCILASGGGAFCQPEIIKLCREFGLTIYLKTPIDVLWERVKNKSHRPLAENGFETFAEILQKRSFHYEKANIIINPSFLYK